MIQKYIPAIIWIWLCGFFMSIHAAATPSGSVRVLILPFEVHSQQDMTYLEDEIPNLMRRQLTEAGAMVLEPDAIEAVSWDDTVPDTEAIRRLGVQLGVDYVINGSMTWIGQKFSVDTRLIMSTGKDLDHTIFLQGEGIENLSGIIREVTQIISLHIFEQKTIAEIRIAGNRRIETDAIQRKITSTPGQIFMDKSLSDDLKSVFSMGYFEDIRIEAEDGPEGRIITFIVEEKPTIRVLRVKGNKVFDDEKIMETLTIKAGSILNVFIIQSNIRRIEELYREKNYHNVQVSYVVHKLDNYQADLEFVIEEGVKVRIKSITFEGNTAFDDKELKKQMATSEKGFFSWITSSGELKQENLSQDANKIAAFYHNNGYVQAKVGEPQVTFEDNWIYIKIKIDEGPRFKVGTVDITGDLVDSKEVLLAKLKIQNEAYYNREVVRKDMLRLSDLYSDQGYAYADISPRINQNVEALVVDITYVITQGKEVYFEEINIAGNIKTRDKVIRRQLAVYEQELFSGVRLKKSVQNLHRLDYFGDIKVNTMKGSADDQMILNIDVTEKPTGFFSIGGGYSSVDHLFAVGSVTQRNLFGRGQVLSLKAELGAASNRYTLSFTEPWWFDIPLSAGGDLYNWEYEYDTYDKDSVGGRLRFGYEIFEYTHAFVYYTYDVSDISNIDEEDASDLIKDLEGINVTSKVTTKLAYDSRDRIINTTEGQRHSVTVDYAGGPLGGDMAFTKYTAETGFFVPLFWSTVGYLHSEVGYAQQNSGGKLPDYERFYLGGMNSIRGFGSRDIYSLDENGAEIGGDKYVQFNVEYIFPLVKEAGVMGVLFFDTGNVFNNDESIDLGDLREAAGGGVRWYSPIGPIRIEYGWILDRKEDEHTRGRWAFSMGQVF